MEDKNFSSDSDFEIEYEKEKQTEMLKSGEFRDILREKITYIYLKKGKKARDLIKSYLHWKLRNLVKLYKI